MSRLSPRPRPYEPDLEKMMDGMRFEGPSPRNLMQALAHAPKFLMRFQALGGTILFSGKLPAREREIAIMRTGARTRSEYEWGMHVALYQGSCGLSDAEICATLHGAGDDPVWSARERLIIRTVDELHDTSTVSDALWRELASEWSEEQLVELILAIGYYHMAAFFLNAVGVPLEDGAARFAGAPT
ncbi:Alkylhydroperoxidase family enzyme, contains CxxC motif [Enhydrobacter aerosaccus]|uniref:Alkylhydroperoxidase family enzyme, contains CxxC motif n=2 Tax=Enhydrobacter aerosaccus TaxID=225324 RepID=A0A1T4S2Y0_9HYPH|nr:Alkylhydroperoxidase family enzyme, contains CxxC motif [Enhydrobacter aerosaccus]